MKATQKKPIGFTLIELLIVVLIIAILAAIAVPNFLEFQTRAKVSRVMSDMRTVSVALQAYYVDFSDVPDDGFDPSFPAPHPDWQETLHVLSTPIAYLSTIPTDPWAQEIVNSDFKFWYANYRGYGEFRNPGRPQNAQGRRSVRLFDSERERYFFCLISPGPEGVWEWDKFGTSEFSGDVLYYDPTNGTISSGDIYLYGPGNEFNPISNFES